MLLRPARGAWDWAAASNLFIPVENLEAEAITLLLRIESDPGRDLRAKAVIAPHSAGDLAIWINAPSPRSIGMIPEPGPIAGTIPVTATEGSVDPSHVSSIRLGVAWPSTPAGAAAGAAQCRRRVARRARQEHARPPGQIHSLRRRKRSGEPVGALSRRKRLQFPRVDRPQESTVFVLAAEPLHTVTNHVADDPEGILGSICSAVGTSANNNAASSGHCAVVIGPKHARTIAGKGWTRHDVRNYLAMHAYNLFSEISFNGRYGKIYNRNLPK